MANESMFMGVGEQRSDVQPSEMTGGFFFVFRLCLAIHEKELLVLSYLRPFFLCPPP